MIVAHFFLPHGRGDWWVIEGNHQSNDSWLFFGLVDLFCQELGYFSSKELEEVELPNGLKIERDNSWIPIELSKLMD